MEVLCIITYEAVVMLVMKEILESEDWHGKAPVRLPPVKRLIEFEETSLPIAMGCLKFENTTMYMFGGEILTDDSYAMGSVNFGFGKLVYDVMTLDLCGPNSKPTCVSKLNGPKIFPIVFEFKSKMYIFSSRVNSHWDNFEVWDPVTRKAPSLPPPSSIFSAIRGYFLTERGVVLAVDNYEGFFFNIDDPIWENSRSRSKPNEFGLSNFQDFVRLHGVLAPGYNDVYLKYIGEGILTVIILEPPLYKTYDLYENYIALNVEYHIEDDISTIADSKEQGLGLGPRYTCALVPCIDYRKEKMRVIIELTVPI